MRRLFGLGKGDSETPAAQPSPSETFTPGQSILARKAAEQPTRLDRLTAQKEQLRQALVKQPDKLTPATMYGLDGVIASSREEMLQRLRALGADTLANQSNIDDQIRHLFLVTKGQFHLTRITNDMAWACQEIQKLYDHYGWEYHPPASDPLEKRRQLEDPTLNYVVKVVEANLPQNSSSTELLLKLIEAAKKFTKLPAEQAARTNWQELTDLNFSYVDGALIDDMTAFINAFIDFYWNARDLGQTNPETQQSARRTVKQLKVVAELLG